jgi:hypothetical protein
MSRKCPTCGQELLRSRPMGPGQGDGTYCTNANCPDYNQRKNIPLDDDE